MTAVLSQSSSLYLAGHRGLVGGAILRLLRERGFDNVITRTSSELDLRDQAAVFRFFEEERPDCVILAAARVGGIMANSTYPADFIYDNLVIASNVIKGAHNSGVRKLLNLGSSCIYPRDAEQPLREEALLTGPLEPTNEAYAIAKIAAIKLCDHFRTQYGCDFISAMPTNLYGPGDNFDLQKSHVLPALMRKMDDARRAGGRAVTLWGSGAPLREFLYVDDMADAALFLLDRFSGAGPINVGAGRDIRIRDVAAIMADVVGFLGEIEWDTTKPDGTPRKLMDVSRIRELGWEARMGLREGLTQTYAWYRRNVADPEPAGVA